MNLIVCCILNAFESIFHKQEPNMSQMLSMMKPLPHDAEYPKEFFVDDLEYLLRTIYHIISCKT